MTTPSRFVARRQEQQLLLYAISQLPAPQRAVFELYYADGKSSREIAEALNITVTTVTTRLARTRVLLRTFMDELRPSNQLASLVMQDLTAWTRSIHATQDWSRALASGATS